MKVKKAKPFKRVTRGEIHSHKSLQTTKLYVKDRFLGYVENLTGRLFTQSGANSHPGTKAHDSRREAARDAGIEISSQVESWEKRFLAKKRGEDA